MNRPSSNVIRKETKSPGSHGRPLNQVFSLVMLILGFGIGHVSNRSSNNCGNLKVPSQTATVALRSSTTTTTTTSAPTCPEVSVLAPPIPKTIVETKETPPPPICTADTCRDTVFRAIGQGGKQELSEEMVATSCAHPLSYHVCQDLMNFTGLSTDEFNVRMMRKGRFHFEGEHSFWNPQSSTELAWYYTTSVNYLFANAIHPAIPQLQFLEQHHQPVLDYSGGVGNSVLYVALKKKLKAYYFGIGLMEKAFAEFRFRSRGLMGHEQHEGGDNATKINTNEEALVTVISPWSERTGWKFDPIEGPLPRDGSLGAILANDVLEHIPKYHLVVEAMVQSLRVGGVIVENSPFAKTESKDEVDNRVHVSSGGISMETAMGPTMEFNAKRRWWVKIS